MLCFAHASNKRLSMFRRFSSGAQGIHPFRDNIIEGVGVLSRGGPGWAFATGVAIATSVATLAAAGVVFINRRDVRAPAYLEFAFLLLVIPLLTPQGWDYMLLLGTPAIALLLDRWQLLRVQLRFAVAAALIVIALPMREVLGLSVTVTVMMTGVVTLAAVVLAAALVRLRLERAA